jgi:hypothetical protein
MGLMILAYSLSLSIICFGINNESIKSNRWNPELKFSAA